MNPIPPIPSPAPEWSHRDHSNTEPVLSPRIRDIKEEERKMDEDIQTDFKGITRRGTV